MHRSTLVAVAAVIVASASPAYAEGSPWLPAPGGGSFTVSVVSQSATEFWRSDKKGPTPGGGETLSQRTVWVDGTYGLSDSIAFDFRAGGATSNFVTGPGIPTPQESFSGLQDVRAGLVWRVLDEVVSNGATIAFRAGAIVGGGYETGYINSLGDGGSGLEVSALVGRFLSDWFAVSSEVGYRYRNNDIPANAFVKLAGGLVLGPGVGLSLNYMIDDSLSGLEIGGPGFSPARFPELQEDIHLLGGSVSIPVSDRVSIGASYGKVIKGRNTAASNVFSASVGYSFN